MCSPFTKEIKRAISILGYNPQIIILDPHTLSDILDNILEIAKNVGKNKEGENLVKSLEPGPRTITRIEILAKIISPKEFDYIQTPEMRILEINVVKII